jgi:predicted DNA-binding transcriptional regulator AlpA
MQKLPPMPSPDAAEYIGMSDAWLRKGRMNRDPNSPPYIRIGKAVRYLPEDLDSWLRSKRVQNGEAA